MMSISVCAQQPQQKLTRKQKRYIKIAKELDVLQYLPAQSDLCPTTFWDSVTINNQPLQEDIERFNNPKGLAKSAVKKVNQMISKNYIFNMSYHSNDEERVNRVFRDYMLGKDYRDKRITFRIRTDSDINAYCTPDGYIYFNSGLIDALADNTDMLDGVLAHELTHYFFKHALRHEFSTLKRQRSNNIAAAISVAAVGIANMYAASSGAPTDSAAQRKTYENIIDGANEWTEAFYYRYGREEELVTDIVAFRFLEWMGANPECYIKMLEIINGPWAGKETDRYDDHPSPEDRIGVLRALAPAPFRHYKTGEDN